MKKLLVLASLLTSIASAQAMDGNMIFLVISAPTIGTTSISMAISPEAGWCKEARQIIADGQEYNLTGELTPYLEAKMKLVQELEADLSADEAIDMLIEGAVSVLN